MPDMKNLSKYKYIYRIYESSDKILHIERCPIIYINSEVVYFKMARKQEFIHQVDFNKIRDNMRDYYTSTYLNYPCYAEYYWNTEYNVYEIFNELKRQQEYFRENEKMIDVEKRYNRAKENYEIALKVYETEKIKYESMQNS